MALVYNRTKAEQTLLKAHETSPPSLSVDLFTEYWRLNSGPNCLYHTPIAVCGIQKLLSCIPSHLSLRRFSRIFAHDESRSISFRSSMPCEYHSTMVRLGWMLCMLIPNPMFQYPGSLIVEIHDHRDQPVGDPVSERVVLWPNDETLYAEICLAASKDPGKTDLDALTFEANHLVCAQWCQSSS